MNRLNNQNIIVESLAMRDEVKERIRINSMNTRERENKKRGFKYSRLIAAASLVLALTLGAGAYYIGGGERNVPEL